MQRDWQLEELTPADYESAMRLWNASPGVNANETPAEFARILARNLGMSFCVRLEGRLIAAVFCGHDGHRGFLYHLAVEPVPPQGIATARRACLSVWEWKDYAAASTFSDNDDGAAFWRAQAGRERQTCW
jgi:hypothetical protein